MKEKERIINNLKKEFRELKLKYEDLKKRYILQNDELCKLKAYISEVLSNENKH